MDVDTAQDIAQAYDVSGMPTFIFLKRGNILDQVVGADPKKITDLVQRHGV